MLELNFYKFTEKITIKIFVNPKDRIYDLYKDECEKKPKGVEQNSKDGNILRVSL